MRIKHLRLQTRFFFAFLLVAGTLLLAGVSFFYSYVSHILIDQETNALLTLTSSFQNQCDEAVRNMDSVSTNINYSSALKALFQEESLDFTEVPLEEFVALATTINGVEHKVNQINLFDYQGNKLLMGQVTKKSMATYEDQLWIEEARQLDGAKLISTPYKTGSLSTNSGEWYISLYRSFSNNQHRTIGAIETIKQCKIVFKSITSYGAKNSDGAKTYVYNTKGELLYPYNLQEIDDSLYNYYELVDESTTHLTNNNTNTGKKEVITYSTSSFTDWTYITVQPEEAILAPVTSLLHLVMLVTLGAFLLCVLVAYYMSRTLMQPINHLKEDILQTEITTLHKPSHLPWKNSYVELEELNKSFQTMRKNLNTSMNDLIETRKQEIKSRTMALQSQVNPHFYYNSLASIIILAEHDRKNEVIQMCHNLTNMMRYISDTDIETTIQQEIDYVEKYLYCMKVRYQRSLTYSIDIDKQLQNIVIPRLIIQPIVENALKYGLDTDPPWNITIQGYLIDVASLELDATAHPGGWQIDIIDSGNGFSDQALQTIEERIQESAHHIGMPTMHIDGMGTLNVYLRWKLFCKESMLFEIGNTLDGHGKVSIGQRYFAQSDKPCNPANPEKPKP